MAMLGDKRKHSGNVAKENECYDPNTSRQSIEIAKLSTNALLNGQAPALTSYNEQVKLQGLAQRKEKESDSLKIKARLKQIQFGKNTKGYDNYLLLVPKDKRDSKDYTEHPRTPDPCEKYSKRAFDGLIQQWRRNLHKYDDKNSNANSFTSNDIEEESVSGKKMRTEIVVAEKNANANDTDENSLVDYVEDTETIEYLRHKSVSTSNSLSTHVDVDDDDDDVL